MARPQSRYVCQSCGASVLRWEGQCRDCGAWNTLVETLVAPERARRASGGPGSNEPVALRDLDDPAVTRLSTGVGELDRVLGGGLVPGSAVLLAGEPGIGKSTLVLEAAAGVAAVSGATVLYASGEESAGQLRLRASRLGLLEGRAGESVRVLAETDAEAIAERALAARPDLLVVDSIQTVRLASLEGAPGSVGQVRESAARLVELAKGEGIPLVLVGHVTKDGTIAGPKTLEHLVDAVLALEGERLGPRRILRASKNRFGSTEEIGVFEMAASGLREVTDASRAFLGTASAGAPGVAIAATLEGTRPILVEVQALVAPAAFGSPRRTVGGADGNRVALLLAVLGRRAGVGLGTHDLYLSLAGGIAVDEPALDLPVALAIASSWRDRPLLPETVSAGEVGLLGELRPTEGLGRRLREAARLGFRRAIVPAAGALDDAPEELEIVRVGSLREAIDAGLMRPAEPAARGAAVANAAR